MEWSIGNSGSRYKVSFSEKEELLSLSKLISEDKEINFDNISIRKDQQAGRLLVDLDGK